MRESTVQDLTEELTRYMRTTNILRYERNKMLEMLDDIAACCTFDEYDPKECTEEVYEWGKALVDTARQALMDMGWEDVEEAS